MIPVLRQVQNQLICRFYNLRQYLNQSLQNYVDCYEKSLNSQEVDSQRSHKSYDRLRTPKDSEGSSLRSYNTSRCQPSRDGSSRRHQGSRRFRQVNSNASRIGSQSGQMHCHHEPICRPCCNTCHCQICHCNRCHCNMFQCRQCHPRRRR
jgi:hypothetical protein